MWKTLAWHHYAMQLFLWDIFIMGIPILAPEKVVFILKWCSECIEVILVKFSHSDILSSDIIWATTCGMKTRHLNRISILIFSEVSFSNWWWPPRNRLKTGLNSLWPSDAIWWQRSRLTLVQVMAYCLTAPSHYLNQCWLVISEVQIQLLEGNSTADTSAINI